MYVWVLKIVNLRLCILTITTKGAGNDEEIMAIDGSCGFGYYF